VGIPKTKETENAIEEKKAFLTYNQQMKKLRNDKGIDCNGSKHKKILVRNGYFNIINGYKEPFTSGKTNGHYNYIPNTSIDEIYTVKQFDDSLRSFFLQRITQVEEEVRTLAGYKFDATNDAGRTHWYDVNAYAPTKNIQERMKAISSAYSELSRSRLDYVKFYMDNHQHIPTWIMIKVINFATFIKILECGKTEVSHALCELYDLIDCRGYPNVKLLTGSLHWFRHVRNSCAHNERIYCLSGSKNSRIKERYISDLSPHYRREEEKKIFDLIVYFKYYLPNNEYTDFINEFYALLCGLKDQIHPNAFDYIRGKIGIRELNDLLTLRDMKKNDIDYNKFNN
jgi:Abortive infection bacteriophage resistance protein